MIMLSRPMGATNQALAPCVEQGCQGRPKDARRGSLDGPVICWSENGMGSPPGLPGRSFVMPGRERAAVHPQCQSMLAGNPRTRVPSICSPR